jgi:hypothetical protein
MGLLGERTRRAGPAGGLAISDAVDGSRNCVAAQREEQPVVADRERRSCVRRRWLECHGVSVRRRWLQVASATATFGGATPRGRGVRPTSRRGGCAASSSRGRADARGGCVAGRPPGAPGAIPGNAPLRRRRAIRELPLRERRDRLDMAASVAVAMRRACAPSRTLGPVRRPATRARPDMAASPMAMLRSRGLERSPSGLAPRRLAIAGASARLAPARSTTMVCSAVRELPRSRRASAHVPHAGLRHSADLGRASGAGAPARCAPGRSAAPGRAVGPRGPRIARVVSRGRRLNVPAANRVCRKRDVCRPTRPRDTRRCRGAEPRVRASRRAPRVRALDLVRAGSRAAAARMRALRARSVGALAVSSTAPHPPT